MTATKPPSPNKARRAAKDAIALLKADHAAVSKLFAEYEKSRSIKKKKALVAKICTELSVHAQIEEEILYPAVKKALKDKMMVPEAMVEHAGVKDLIAQMVLSEYVKHHVKEEQNEMFPKVRASSLDMIDLGARLAKRKEELLTDMA